MNRARHTLFILASALALGGLSACTAPSFKADVSRFHAQLPPPAQGQSFTIAADDPQYAGSLEFAHYADLIAQRLSDFGYHRSDDPAAAQLVVHLDYSVDKGTQRVRPTGYARDPFFYDPFFYPYPHAYYRGWRGRYSFGYYDPFLWGPGYDDLDTFVVYQSQLKMKIDKAEGGRVFEGTAKAQSLSNKLTYLVPNLIDALFTGFPGKDGEEIKVTVGPEPKK